MDSGILARKLRRNHQEAVHPQGHGGELVAPVGQSPSFAGFGTFMGDSLVCDGNPKMFFGQRLEESHSNTSYHCPSTNHQ
jgi:hypothetical protein